MFVQFRVEFLQDSIAKTNEEIASYENRIEALEIEWVYLTRPQRLRDLASKYLQTNTYSEVSQIKDLARLKNYYLANYNKQAKQQIFVQNNKNQELKEHYQEQSQELAMR